MSKNSKHFKGSTKMWPANAIVIILEFDWNRKWGPDISFFLGKKRVVQFVRDVSWATNVGVAVPQYCDKFRQNCVVILRPSTKYLRFLLRESNYFSAWSTHLYYYTKIWHYITTEKWKLFQCKYFVLQLYFASYILYKMHFRNSILKSCLGIVASNSK